MQKLTYTKTLFDFDRHRSSTFDSFLETLQEVHAALTPEERQTAMAELIDEEDYPRFWIWCSHTETDEEATAREAAQAASIERRRVQAERHQRAEYERLKRIFESTGPTS